MTDQMKKEKSWAISSLTEGDKRKLNKSQQNKGLMENFVGD